MLKGIGRGEDMNCIKKYKISIIIFASFLVLVLGYKNIVNNKFENIIAKDEPKEIQEIIKAMTETDMPVVKENGVTTGEYYRKSLYKILEIDNEKYIIIKSYSTAGRTKTIKSINFKDNSMIITLKEKVNKNTDYAQSSEQVYSVGKLSNIESKVILKEKNSQIEIIEFQTEQ